MNKMKFEAVATIGEYKTATGEIKKRYLRVGTVFENEDGRLALKLDALPTSKDWSGYVNFYEPKPRENRPQQTPQPQQSTGSFADTGDLGEGDDIPF